MLRILAALGLLTFAMPVHAQTLRDPRVDQIITDVRDARDLARSIPDPGLRDRIELLLARAELTAREMQRAHVVAPAPGAAVMSDADLQKFLTALKGQSFDEGKLSIVKTLVPPARLRSDQLRRILATFTFDKDRAEAAVGLHPLLVDPHLFAVALDAFTFNTNREEVLKRIRVP